MTTSRTALGKGLAVLGAFSHRHPRLTLSAIARETGLALATTHRVVSELAAWGALERDEDGRWHVGLRLWEVAAVSPRTLGLRDAALPFMQDLYEITHENVQLGVREDEQVVFIERFASHGSVPVRTEVGGRFALTPTGVGLVLLAHAPPEVQAHVLAEPPARHTPMTLTSPTQLRRVLAEVRRCGYAISDRQVTMDAVSVAAPVRGSAGAVVAALSIVVRGHGASAVRPYIPAVQAAAMGISRQLASRP
ncbi:MAG: IclR family transcriptional regulator [Dermatophilaceae bacterium]